jgi:hypothetical protein
MDTEFEDLDQPESSSFFLLEGYLNGLSNRCLTRVAHSHPKGRTVNSFFDHSVVFDAVLSSCDVRLDGVCLVEFDRQEEIFEMSLTQDAWESSEPSLVEMLTSSAGRDLCIFDTQSSLADAFYNEIGPKNPKNRKEGKKHPKGPISKLAAIQALQKAKRSGFTPAYLEALPNIIQQRLEQKFPDNAEKRAEVLELLAAQIAALTSKVSTDKSDQLKSIPNSAERLEDILRKIEHVNEIDLIVADLSMQVGFQNLLMSIAQMLPKKEMAVNVFLPCWSPMLITSSSKTTILDNMLNRVGFDKFDKSEDNLELSVLKVYKTESFMFHPLVFLRLAERHDGSTDSDDPNRLGWIGYYLHNEKAGDYPTLLPPGAVESYIDLQRPRAMEHSNLASCYRAKVLQEA